MLKPISEQQLERLVEHHLAQRNSQSDMETISSDVEEIGDDVYFVAASPRMRKIRAQAELLANIDVPILITGESGSGKKVLAQLIHKLSARSQHRFARVNCAALSADVLENELFGSPGSAGSVSPGAEPTGGSLELCHKGTILLDELTEMPARLQAKLLCVLQDRHLFGLEGQNAIVMDVRVLATTNVDLEKAVAEKKLRQDLYYRLNAFTIGMPPLRERREELKVLLDQCMMRMARRYGLPSRAFSPALLAACQSYAWPGNLRELENFVKRYLVMADESLGSAPEEVVQGPSPQAAKPGNGETGADVEGLKMLVRSIKGQTEKDAISITLEKTGWNRKQAALLLRISYRSLLYKIEEYQLTKPANWASAGEGNGKRSGQTERPLPVDRQNIQVH